MWVLDARKDAEKVWFPVVWEEKKDASNIIDYDIHEEITIDTSSVFNANNDTTTGMATVIPWVNSPKLKMSTSIYMDKEIVVQTVIQSLYWVWEAIHRPDETSTPIRNLTSQSSYWNTEITYYQDPRWILYSGMKIPVAWYYEMNIRYSWASSSFWWKYEFKTPRWWWSSDLIWHTYETEWSWSYKYETITRYFEKWEVFSLFVTMNRSGTTQLTATPDILIDITKL